MSDLASNKLIIPYLCMTIETDHQTLKVLSPKSFSVTSESSALCDTEFRSLPLVFRFPISAPSLVVTVCEEFLLTER